MSHLGALPYTCATFQGTFYNLQKTFFFFLVWDGNIYIYTIALRPILYPKCKLSIILTWSPFYGHTLFGRGGRGGGLSWNKIGACEVLTPQRRIHSNTNQWCCGWGETIAKDYYNPTLFWKCLSSFTLPLCFLACLTH